MDYNGLLVVLLAEKQQEILDLREKLARLNLKQEDLDSTEEP